MARITSINSEMKTIFHVSNLFSQASFSPVPWLPQILENPARFFSDYNFIGSSGSHKSSPSTHVTSFHQPHRVDPYVFANPSSSETKRKDSNSKAPLIEKSNLDNKRQTTDEGGKILKDHNPSIVPGTDDASIVTVAGMKAFQKLEQEIQQKNQSSPAKQRNHENHLTTQSTDKEKRYDHQATTTSFSSLSTPNQQLHPSPDSQPTTLQQNKLSKWASPSHSSSKSRNQHIRHQQQPTEERKKHHNFAMADLALGHDYELLSTALGAFVNLEIKLKKQNLPSLGSIQLKDLEPPAPLNPTECCGKECMRCVWVRYSDQLSSYEAAKQYLTDSPASSSTSFMKLRK